jgi:DNA-directed RNA polymerase subunit M/transcription elongation factor TFIIS
MECPKCKSKNIFIHKIDRRVFDNNKIEKVKKYECLKCGHKFDIR